MEQNTFQRERPSLAPPSLRTSGASASTNHTSSRALNTTFSNASNDAEHVQSGIYLANEMRPQEMAPPMDAPRDHQVGYPTELK